ncbi:hypothetical protein [Pseudomonas sp. AS2.8]|uniref:hypothetical protein n=1 Tax=Pseudomonas sp. AS2.8 TaxID=2587128 RepID=UPI00161B1E5A|nr:hypothetical protein [Pseudomonas sp. AS2.8]MBB2897797.1 hypothetical protein [Pseudomonas sp. AS2.8]
MTTHIIVEDAVTPQLLTSAIEAYEFDRERGSRKKDALGQIETYGLLWGYCVPAFDQRPARVVCTTATVELSADRRQDSVTPNLESIIAKRDFFRRYWPQLDLVGSFHSHPYANLKEVRKEKGWQASETDKDHWPYIHDYLMPELPLMAHLVVTICARQRATFYEAPQRLGGREENSGYHLAAAKRHFWLRGYVSSLEDEGHISMSDDVALDVTSFGSGFKNFV